MEDIMMPLALDEIEVGDGRREVDTKSVKKLAESIKEIGLRHPITVRRRGERYILVAGRHRLEAFKSIGREHIPACIVSMTNADARKWEIAENLHRAELTKLDRDVMVAEWIKLTEVSVQFAQKGNGRPESGISAASRELGIERSDASRAVSVAAISDEAKDAAREYGLDDNRTALLQVARESPENQVAKVIQLSDHPKDDYERSAEWRRGFERHWNKAPSKEDHEWARGWIDRPIMDARFK